MVDHSTDHAALAKYSFLAGVLLFAGGILGSFFLGTDSHSGLTLLSAAGILIGLCAPIFFGIVQPLRTGN
ncbi:hypothetical protein [Salinibaculum rarum]|uniref:DUF7860 family protein n=1 Tax=Salinibaculum rarum TaxID=3058903 RepID=UPI00265ED809|nr:hypothetical protein [Salinibaculum sp. KK48]